MSTYTAAELNELQRTDNDEWLRIAAARLDSEGQHELATQARAEIGSMVALRQPREQVTQRCDSCRKVVRSQRQINRFASVDWVLCSKCEG